jgi:hypothetical protein
MTRTLPVTVRRFNYTGRRKISARDVTVSLIQRDGTVPHFDAELRLSAYDLPGEAHVFVEAYHQTVRMPFAFGTIDNIRPPEDRRLTEFDEAPELARFRVRVTDFGNVKGMLLAEVSGISPRSEDAAESESLLELKPAPLGSVPYVVDFSGERVRLLINDAMPNWRAFSESALFKSLAGPIVLREILNRILHVEHESDPDGSTWQNQWLKLVTNLPGSPGPPPDVVDGESAEEKCDEIDDWVQDVVAAFSDQQRSLEKLRSVLSENDPQ